jgi:ATP-dependent DNA ligase
MPPRRRPAPVTVDPFTGSGALLLEAMRRLGAEGIVSKRRAALIAAGPAATC